MTRLDEIEHEWEDTMAWSRLQGMKDAVAENVLALVAVARAADDVSCDGCDYPDKFCGTARRGKCRSCRLREVLAPLLEEAGPERGAVDG